MNRQLVVVCSSVFRHLARDETKGIGRIHHIKSALHGAVNSEELDQVLTFICSLRRACRRAAPIENVIKQYCRYLLISWIKKIEAAKILIGKFYS
jgi:hypothetical protein